jgi:hypothetical protein
MIDKDILGKIQAHAVDMDWNVAFGGKACGNQHLFRVVIIANFLAEKEGANQEICEAGAWLHDIGLIAGNDDNPAAIRCIAEEYLMSLGLDDVTQRRIAECAETHEGGKRAVSLEARVVHDADVLDKMGLLGVIRHTWKVVNLIHPDANASDVCSLVQQHLQTRQERLYTTAARKLVGALNAASRQFFEDRKQAVESISTIMQDAKQGVISDKIARKLLLQTDNQSLMDQLCISDKILQWWYEQG